MVIDSQSTKLGIELNDNLNKLELISIFLTFPRTMEIKAKRRDYFSLYYEAWVDGW